MTAALLLVDLQNDFLPGGPLAVPGGDAVIPVANRLQARYPVIVATQDWHPPDHGSFAANHDGRQPGETVLLDGLEQILWPTHCVQETPGAAFAGQLNTSRIAAVVQKGTNRLVDSYSGFFDNGRREETGLHACLQGLGVDRLAVLGLATDYCVKYTVLDALELGYPTELVLDGCRAVELHAGDGAAALRTMQQAGARLISSTEQC